MAEGGSEGLPRAEASLEVEEPPEILGRRSEASLFTCVEPMLWKGCKVEPHVVMGEGRPLNCKGVRSLGGWTWGGAHGLTVGVLSAYRFLRWPRSLCCFEC